VVTCFNHEKEFVQVKKEEVNYYTRARSSKSTRIINVLDSKNVKGTRIGFGKLKITDQVTGYDRKLVSTHRSIGIIPLDLPKLEFETQGVWIEIPDKIKDKIESDSMNFMGEIYALEHSAIGIMLFLVMADRNNIGSISIPYDSQVDKAAVFIYDGIPDGMGLLQNSF
jgi:DEAD/DEAH box helicase domain-containing protein